MEYVRYQWSNINSSVQHCLLHCNLPEMETKNCKLEVTLGMVIGKKKIPAATYVRDYFINITKKPKKLKKCVIFGNRNWLEVYYYELPYDQGQ